VTYTIIRGGVPARQIRSGNVTFDADSQGVLLGAHCTDGADWVREIMKFLMAGKIRIDVED